MRRARVVTESEKQEITSRTTLGFTGFVARKLDSCSQNLRHCTRSGLGTGDRLGHMARYQLSPNRGRASGYR